MNAPYQKHFQIILITASAISLLVLSMISVFRIDLTNEKRFSISQISKQQVNELNAPLHITLYLSGDLNPGFQRLKRATLDMLSELKSHSNQSFKIDVINPSESENHSSREAFYNVLTKRGMTATAIYERDKEGKAIQKIVFPWVEIKYKDKNLAVNLLKNVRGLSGEENLNISIENLEYELMDGIRRISNTQISKIAFIEGHGEYTEAETYSISKTLSRYYQIDRGVIGNDASILKPYKAIIIAGPTRAFSETDKFIIDQYIMQGGSVLWLIDPVRIARENFSKSGFSPAIAHDLNLTDQFFKYGIRMKPVLIQDVQCVQIPVNIAAPGSEPQFEPTPWLFAPLLLASQQHVITKNITEVKSDFASVVEIVGSNNAVRSTLLLASSDNSRVIATPATIDLAKLDDATRTELFVQQYLPVAVLQEGVFSSVFENRMLPQNLENLTAHRSKSVPTKQIFIADADIIRNETNGIPSDSTTLPLGFDRYMNIQFGNNDFIQHAVLYLAGNEKWLELRSRNFKLRLLNKNIMKQDRLFWQMVALTAPLTLILGFGFCYQYRRKRLANAFSKQATDKK